MKIQRLIFENSYNFENFVQDKWFDFIMKIETNDPTFIKENIINLWILKRDSSLRFEFLKEILDFFDYSIQKEKLEIDELIFQIHTDSIEFQYILDIWNSHIWFEEESNYRSELIEKLHINLLEIHLPQSTKTLSLNHIWSIADNIKISVHARDDIDSISVNNSSELHINWAGNSSIREIRIWDLQDHQKIYINNVNSKEVQILNLGYPFSDKIIDYLEILSSHIEKIELRWFDSSKLRISEARFWSTIITWWIVENIDFLKLSMVDARILNTWFTDVFFPKKSKYFLLKNCYLKENTYSNIDWWNYFSEYELAQWEKDWKINEKRWYISKWGLKETYRMLKYEHDQIWNKTEANKFFAKEMKYYRKSLLENYTWKTFFDVWIWQKRVICWYNQFTNDFWDSWIRPIIWMTILVLFATGYQFLNSTAGFSWNRQILSNILPISEIWKFTTWYNFFYQIAWTALIYQFIIALRRISQR